MNKLSIVTGTLNRLNLLPGLLENTIYQNENIELVIVDGGSTDGTVEYLDSINHPRLKKIFIGHRSHYWHYMNIGIKESTHEWICQWNDDVLMLNDWSEILSKLNAQDHQMYVFSWKEEYHDDYFIINTDDETLDHYKEGQSFGNPLTVMNFGIYHKDVFRKVGLYDSSYIFYYCDGDMSARAQYAGFKCLKMYEVRCKSLSVNYKNAYHVNLAEEMQNYRNKLNEYKEKKFPTDNLLFDKKVISFSIYGDSNKYTIGLLKNVELAKKYYPDWICYIYYDNSVPKDIINKLQLNMNCKTIDKSNSNIPGMFWRFLPFGNIERFIVRDADSRISERDKEAVDAWINEQTTLHIMRDHTHHGYYILGGMWGMKSIENLEESISQYIKDKSYDKEVRMLDMDYLRDYVYPKYCSDSTIHCSINEYRIEGNSKPFPSKMIDFKFVGEIFDETDKRSYQYQELFGRNDI